MMNISDSTCWYGLAQTEEGCVRTLASYDPSSYVAYQIGYCVIGAVSIIASAVMTTRAFNHDGFKLQQCSFAFCSYTSVTVIVRGVDPSSYGHVILRPISSFWSDSCTAALYSCYVLALGYWALIMQQGAGGAVNKPTRLKCLESSVIVFIWAFYIVYDMMLFVYKGFNAALLSYLQLTVSAVVLGIICAAFLIYGLRVLSRLQDVENQKKHRMPSMLSERMMTRSFNMETLSDYEDGVPVIHEPRYARRRPESGHVTKIKKILFVAVSLSLIVIAGQIYMAVVRTFHAPRALVRQRNRMRHHQIEPQRASCTAGGLHLGHLVGFPRRLKKEVRPQPLSAV
ncbi:hypothetical protein PHYPSEUDO_014276 [Phytophthora pseudosyringae]|uniref:THH1/TOM1/TOM3 domain-containing protein n=1 Tax=Phytophthora pseudosyringae TaxID=221518 RepID=A0A8T1WM36_9STRA|nr:hypothetical protein PHYPSEUDO_014276 [Phytophthora pseudosyringae]